MTNADVYISKYKELEAVVRSVYGLSENDSISYYLKNKSEFKKYRDEITYCQDIRNILQHKTTFGSAYAVEPSDSMIEFIDSLITKIRIRPKCLDYAIMLKNIYWCSYSDNVKTAMTNMRKNVFTHIPILENGQVVGIFDENSVFNYLADNEIIEVDQRITFSDITPYLNINGRDMEEFLFIKSTLYVDELQKKIDYFYRKGKRVGVAFLTVNGKQEEKLQGLITPWDILSVES